MYDDVIKLRKQGLKYKEIQRRIYEKYGKQISIRNIYSWINGKHNPLRRINKFNGKASPELEYVVGTMFSDGFKYFNNGKHILCLSVKDKEFAEEFGRCLSKVLGKKESYKPYWDKSLKTWVVKECSIQLYKFLDKPLEELKPYIEHCKDCVSAFLRALFDAEGCIYVKIKEGKRQRILMLYNTNKELLTYVQYLLKKYFDIDTTGPHLAKRKGSIMYFPNGKIAKTNENCYYIYIRANSLLNFYEYIGFTIKRKQRTLIKAIK